MRLVAPVTLLVVATLGTSGAADLPAIQKRGTLRVLVVEGSPRFFALPKDAPPGMDREILTGFAAVQKLVLTVVPVASWDVLVPALLEDRGDLAAGGMTVTEARARQVAFTTEVFPTREVVVTRKPHASVTTLEALRTERVGTIKGTSMADALRDARVPAANTDDSFASGKLEEALRSGRVTAVVLGVEDAIVAQQADPEMQIGLFLGAKGSLAFAVRKDSPALLRALDGYVGNVRRTSTWNRLVVKYFGKASLEILQRSQAP
jgi:ABC-type amino acid transport substrate-binding protein